MNVISNVIVFSDTHLHINVMKVPFRTALVLASFDSIKCIKILDGSLNSPDRYTTIDGNVLFFEKRRHSDDDLLYFNRNFATPWPS